MNILRFRAFLVFRVLRGLLLVLVLLLSIAIIGTPTAAYTPPFGLTLTASNTPSVSLGQYEVFTASFTAGSDGGYTYNYQIVNSITNVLVTNMLWTNALTTNTFIWYVPSVYFGNTVTANVFVTDTNPTTINSILIPTITIGGSSGPQESADPVLPLVVLSGAFLVVYGFSKINTKGLGNG